VQYGDKLKSVRKFQANNLVSLRRHYNNAYGEDLILFAKGELKAEGVQALTLKLFPLFGIMIKHQLSEHLINQWLGTYGNHPQQHFIKCNEEAKSYSRMWLEDANISNKIDFKKYSSYMYRMFSITVEPPKPNEDTLTIEAKDEFLALEEQTTEA
jgi:hypothetical protein